MGTEMFCTVSLQTKSFSFDHDQDLVGHFDRYDVTLQVRDYVSIQLIDECHPTPVLKSMDLSVLAVQRFAPWGR
jgi:hypothetical protein